MKSLWTFLLAFSIASGATLSGTGDRALAFPGLGKKKDAEKADAPKKAKPEKSGSSDASHEFDRILQDHAPVDGEAHFDKLLKAKPGEVKPPEFDHSAQTEQVPQIDETAVKPVGKQKQAPPDEAPHSTDAGEFNSPAPVLDDKTVLQGSATENALHGYGSDSLLQGQTTDGGGSLNPKMAPQGNVLKGSATALDGGLADSDPDMQDRELQVEWDRWRNRFLRAVQLSVQEKVNNPDPEEGIEPHFNPYTNTLEPAFPLGIGSTFSCRVLPDRSIVDFKILRSSGYPKYDRVVQQAVRELEGTSQLQYPANSKRKQVTQAATIKTAERDDFRYYKFGDVERYREQMP
jgi:hypothetical protein